MKERNVVSWTSLIVGLAVNGFGKEALELFRDLERKGFLPTAVTFVGVLYACSHCAMVDEGFNYFELMKKEYGLVPRIEHYGCVVDLLGRSGKDGIAHHSGSNAAILAVETFIGKKTSIQAPSHLMGQPGIKWATLGIERVDLAIGKKRGGPFYLKAYDIANVLRTSIYGAVFAFHDEMLKSAKLGHLEKDWIISIQPWFVTRELLLHKLRIFLDF
ncbi:pentatricopeptide repeat-containing protein At4g18840-like [Carya illinoinensis]|uniref:pentatricopeptide repeat-containing protein At4g18840-like n=1 Tax=Carya illinoinensis TaxID=32201 RepID=UPI001C722083|nr:pentatricopeptide repeat-containing protein At4g18840-like [Carya illinoinensis]